MFLVLNSFFKFHEYKFLKLNHSKISHHNNNETVLQCYDWLVGRGGGGELARLLSKVMKSKCIIRLRFSTTMCS